jgi:plastocyanin
MSKWICCGALTLLALSLGTTAQTATQPTQPTTLPATTQPDGPVGAVHGTVSWAANLDLDKPDLSRAVVYFESDPALDDLPTNPAPATVAQKNKAFVPNFAVVSVGTLIEFPNWDHISHNVFSRSAAAPAFDLDRYPYGRSKSRVFTKVGVVQLFCNIHPWMRAIVVVTPNRFFTRVGSDGQFKIDGIPPGRYQLTVWQERCASQHAVVDISVGGNASVSLQLSEDRADIIANDAPRHGAHYGVDRGLGVKREILNLPVVTESHPAPTTEPCPMCNQ